MAVSSAFGYGEINEGGYTSPLMTTLATIKDPRFIAVSIHEKRDVYPALKRFFTPTPAGGAGGGGGGVATAGSSGGRG